MASNWNFDSELRSVIATLYCLAEVAAERGDARSCKVLHGTAALLDARRLHPGILAVTIPEPCESSR